MAKLTTSDIYVRTASGSIPAPRGRALTKYPTKWRYLKSSVGIVRTGAAGEKAFQSCVEVANAGRGFKAGAAKRASGFSMACAHGRNPREAIRKALSTAARKMKTRSGAFAGLRKRR
jgi:hypothetical protein